METSNRKRSVKISSHGLLAVEIGSSIKFPGYEVFYDHGDSNEGVGRIISFFEDKSNRSVQLSSLDIAIVRKKNHQVIALVEFEETNSVPKTFLGDAFGVLMGEGITYQGRSLEVGKWTTLVIVGVSKVSRQRRNRYILDQVKKVKSVLETRNSSIGNVVIETFTDQKELLASLPLLLEKVVKGKE